MSGEGAQAGGAVARRAAARPRASNRQLWLGLPLALPALPLASFLAGDAAAKAPPAVLLAVLAAAVGAAVLTRQVTTQSAPGGPRFPGGMLIVAARSPLALLRALALAFLWLVAVAATLVVALALAPGSVPYVYLFVVTHAVVASALQVLTAQTPTRALRHRRVHGTIRLPASAPARFGWPQVIAALESAHEERTKPLGMTIVDRSGSPVLSTASQAIEGPCELRIYEDDWLQTLLGFRYLHYRLDLAAPATVSGREVDLDDLCSVVRAGRLRDFLRLAAGRAPRFREKP